MNPDQQRIYHDDYMKYIVKWGKITSWLSIPLIFIPALVLMAVFGARPSFTGVLTGFISLFSAMFAWYIVDPITLYPILHIPGMYLTYIAGNSKEIRAPAATSALSATEVQAGTEHGTIISCLAITTSIFISVAVMTLVAVAGNFILSILPPPVITALNFLLPALFGAMCIQRIMLDYKTAAVVVPFAMAMRYLNTLGVFKKLPLGGSYAQLLLCVIVGVLAAKLLHPVPKTMSEKK